MEDEKSQLLSKIEEAFSNIYAGWQARLNREARFREKYGFSYNDPHLVSVRLEAESRMSQTEGLLRIVGDVAGVDLTLRDRTPAIDPK